MAHATDPVRIKRYDNRRLYVADEGRYVSLSELAAMVRTDEDFVVEDAHTGEDVTGSVLKRIITARGRHG